MSTPDTTPSERVADATGPPTRRPRRLTVIADTSPAPGEPGSCLHPQSGAGREPEPAPGLQAACGPLLAVCGLCGGAGASTVAYLVALFTARRQSNPVLVCDTGGPTGGLAHYAGVAAARSLVEVAEQLSAGLPPGRLYATAADGVRVLATGPRFTPGCVRDGVELVLDHARAAHTLTVVDCGTLTGDAEQIALAKASHIAWVLPATPSGVRRGTRVLGAVNPLLLSREFIVARRDEREPKAALDDLKRLAEQCDAPLVLLPHLPDLHTGKVDAALSAAQVSLQAIEGVLER